MDTTLSWDESENPHEELFSLIKKLKQDQSQRLNDFSLHQYLYSNQKSFLRINYNSPPIKLNALQSMIDTVTSKIAKNRVKPMFLTTGGDWSLQNKVKKLNDGIKAIFLKIKLYFLMPLVFRDACIFGTGFAKVFREEDAILVERILPREIFVDDAEAEYGNPRQLFQIKTVSKKLLIDQFPEFESEIKNAGESIDTGIVNKKNKFSEESVDIIEAWILPSFDKAGKHILAIESAVLNPDNTEYKKKYFPFVKFDWSSPIEGFWGQGLIAQCKSIQGEIDRIVTRIQQSLHLIAVPRIMVSTGSRIVNSHLTNEIGGILEYNGNSPPQFHTATAVNAEVYRYLDSLIEKIYQFGGVSQLSATSKKPAGLDAAVAIREYNDIETERFMLVGQNYEQAFLDISERIIDCADEIVEEYGSFPVKAPGKNSIEVIEWKDIRMETDAYLIQVFPTALLPSTPTGKLQTVFDMLKLGLPLGTENIFKLLDFPDLESITREFTAQDEIFDKIIEQIVDGKKVLMPEPFMNLPMGLKRMQQAYVQYLTLDLPEEKLSKFQDWMAIAEQMIQSMAPPPSPNQPAPSPSLPQPQ